MLCIPLAGRWIDRSGSDSVNLVCILGTIVAAVVLLVGGLGGAIGIVALAAGMLLLDIAMQSSQVANQARIFAFRPEARSSLNTAYMTCVVLGGSIGSWLGVHAYTHLGWPGVCGLTAVLATLDLMRHLLHTAAHQRSAVDATTENDEDANLGVPSQLDAESRPSSSRSHS